MKTPISSPIKPTITQGFGDKAVSLGIELMVLI